MFSIEYNHLKLIIAVLNRFGIRPLYLHLILWRGTGPLLHVVWHCLYSRPERTNHTLALDKSFCMMKVMVGCSNTEPFILFHVFFREVLLHSSFITKDGGWGITLFARCGNSVQARMFTKHLIDLLHLTGTLHCLSLLCLFNFVCLFMLHGLMLWCVDGQGLHYAIAPHIVGYLCQAKQISPLSTNFFFYQQESCQKTGHSSPNKDWEGQ